MLSCRCAERLVGERYIAFNHRFYGGLSELAEGARLEIAYTLKGVSWVQIPCPPPKLSPKTPSYQAFWGFFVPEKIRSKCYPVA